MYKTEQLFDLSATIAAPLLADIDFPWDALDKIADFIAAIGPTLSSDEYDNPAPGIWIAKTAEVYASALIKPPCIICAGAQVRHCAFIRGSAVVGRDCVVGNSTELKNVILFDGVQVPHYNYVGDSILGKKAHMGAGAVTSNVKSDRSSVVVRCDGQSVETGRKKLGAMIGDFAEIGCNSVLNPGTVIGRHCIVYPLSQVRGCVEQGHIFKSADNVVPRENRR